MKVLTKLEVQSCMCVRMCVHMCMCMHVYKSLMLDQADAKAVGSHTSALILFH